MRLFAARGACAGCKRGETLPMPLSRSMPAVGSGERPGNCSMRRVKPVVAKTAEQLVAALALPAAEVKEWQVQHELAARLGEIAREQNYTHAPDCRAFRNLPRQGDGDLERRSGARLDGPPDPHPRVTRVQSESVSSQVGDGGVGQFPERRTSPNSLAPREGRLPTGSAVYQP